MSLPFEPVSPEDRRRRSARRRLLRYGTVTVALGVVAALVFGAVKVVTGWLADITPPAPPLAKCALAGSAYTVTPDQAGNAATIAGVALRKGLPERAVLIALATALQESKLSNLDYGDRDSLGLFQQRPSQGWGTPEQIMDPVYSAGKFYAELVKVPDWDRLPVAQVAQEVQRSGFPEAYAQWEEQATVLAKVLVRRVPAGVSCTFEPEEVPAQQAGSEGLTSRAAVLLEAAEAELGSTRRPASGQQLPTASPGTDIAAEFAAAYRSGHALDLVPAGWFSANWLVSQASAKSIRRVAYAGQLWTPDHGWQQVDAAQAPADRIRVLVA
jgi:hypothetical protein